MLSSTEHEPQTQFVELGERTADDPQPRGVMQGQMRKWVIRELRVRKLILLARGGENRQQQRRMEGCKDAEREEMERGRRREEGVGKGFRCKQIIIPL